MCSKNLISLASRTRRYIIVRLVVVSAAFAFTLPLRAADVTSTWNTGTGNWGVNGNWINAPVLGGFPNNGNGGVATYDAVLANGSTITLDQNITIQRFTLSSGTVTGTFNLILNDNLAWTLGTMSGTGVTNVAGAGSTIGGTNSSKGLNRTLNNSGTITSSAGGGFPVLVFGLGSGVTPGVLNNSGTFNVTTSGFFSVGIANAGHAINNSGIWNVSGAGITPSVQTGLAFNNTGAVNVTSGTFAVGGGGTSTGSFAVSSGATLNFTAPYLLDNGTSFTGTGFAGVNTSTVTAGNDATDVITAENFTVSGGTLDGLGALNINNLAWTSGTMSGTGVTNVAGASSTIGGTNSSKGLNRTLNNSGTITSSAGSGFATLVFGLGSGVTPGVLNNSGTFNVTTSGFFSVNIANTGHAINNSGIWNVSGAGITPSVQTGLAFNNTGAVTVTSGTFAVGGGGTSTGSFAVSSGATLNFTAPYLLDNGTSFTGAGFAGVSTSTVTAGNDATDVITAENFTVSGGTLDGLGALNISNLAWTSGTMSGTGVTNVAGASSTISGANSSKGLNRTLNNSGTITSSGSSSFPALVFGLGSGVTPGVLNNSGTFNVTTGGFFSVGTANAGHAINNSGIWNVSGAGITPSVQTGLAFNNTGAVNVNSGTFSLAGTVTQYTGTSLTAGIWRVFANAVLNLPTTGTGIVTNQAEITLSGAGSIFRAGPASATLESKLTTNSGTLRILAGRNFTASNSVANGGVLQLGGGTFAGPGLTNSGTGELFGFGGVTPRPTNSGLIRSSGGTLAFGNGILGGSGTVQIDAGSVLNVSGGSSASSADFLIHNGDTAGSLNLGTNNFTATLDYMNANFGAGNKFNPRANVTGTGGIQAFGGTGQTLSGNVTSGGSATPVLPFGNVRAGSKTTLNYQVNNTGASGPRLRGALQTTVNGGNITDPRLSGSGVTAGNFGPLNPGASTGNLAVVFTPNTVGALSGQTVRVLNNFDNVGDQTLSITGAAYRLAAASAHTPEPVPFPNLHVGDPAPSQALTISNIAAADGFSEGLNASIGSPTGGVTTNGGSFTLLAPGASNNSALAVGISTASAGSKNGTATINLTSDGTGSSGLGTTALAAQTVNVTGSVYRLAQAALPAGTVIDFSIVHVGETVERQITVNNAAAADGFSEALDGSFSGSTGDVTGAGSFVGVAAGASSTAPKVILNTTTAGAKSGTATLAFTSNGAGTSGLASTSLPSQVLNATGQVNNFAAPQFLLDSGPATLTGSGTAYTLDFGVRTSYGALPVARLRLRNVAAAPADTMAGSFSPNAPHYNLSGFKTFTGITAGQDFTPLVVSPTDTLGEFSETITFNGRSQNGSGFDGPLAPVTITLHGIVAAAPDLRVTPSGADVVVSWPVAEQDWVLKRSADLQNWTDVDQPTIDTALEHTVRVPRGIDTKLFFRLEK